MKRSQETLDDPGALAGEEPESKIARGQLDISPESLATQSWKQMCSTLLAPHGVVQELEASPRLCGINHPVTGSQAGDPPDESDVQPELEEVGQMIEDWAEATIHELVDAMDEDDQSELPSSLLPSEDSGPDRMQCFGMLHECRVRLYANMQDLQRKLKDISVSGEAHARLHFVKSYDTGFLRFEDGALCAQLYHRLYDPLSRIADITSVEMVAFAPVNDWISIIEKARRHKDVEINIDINVCGNATVRAIVGQELSNAGLFLQHLKHDVDGCEYDNPHMLLSTRDTLSDNSMDSDGEETTQPSPETVQDVIRGICEAETQERHCDDFEGNAYIKQPLLDHQKQAVPFMVEREIGSEQDDHRLWKKLIDTDRTGFRHAITGSWASELPSEFGGGILADDPGMGKTLSMLCLITQRLGAAQAWAQSSASAEQAGRSQPRVQATLIVVPSSPIISIWERQIRDFVDGALEVVIYHGRSRDKYVAHLSKAEVVITTYNILAMERKQSKSPLHSLSWFRIVLDEAHYIRKQTTTFHTAAIELEARHRWCLTGTPIQNKLEDLGSLLAFIRATPFEKQSMFRKHVILPFYTQLASAKQNLSLLISTVAMRRSTERLNLPPLIERSQFVILSQSERQQYEDTRDRMFHVLRYGSQDASDRARKFQIQLQLRRLCNHGTFQKPWDLNEVDYLAQMEDIVADVGRNGELSCSFCRGRVPVLSTHVSSNGTRQSVPQILCDECTDQDFFSTHEPFTWTEATPSTRIDETRRSFSRESEFNLQGQSSKVTMLLEDLRKDIEHTKSIVFSSWTRSLDLVELHLRRARIVYARVDGRVTPTQRQPVFDTFSHDNDTRVLLMTTGVGAHGLTLTAANRIFILEPLWNPSIEVQAIARAQRVTQEQRVLVTRYIVQNTIEEYVVRQQKTKLNLAETGFSGSRRVQGP